MCIDNKMETWFGTMTFDNNHCFLCGIILDKNNYTKEHVFPKWLQARHDLWDQNLTLPNRTRIKYRQLTVPCCKTCNNEYLSIIEKKVEAAFLQGLDSLRLLEPEIIYKWVMKIFYCLMYKDLSLHADRSNKELGSILTPEFLKKRHFMFDCLQTIRNHIKLDKNFSSLFIFGVYNHIKKDSKLDFFYADDILHSQITIRSNDCGLVCCLGDGGALHERFYKYFQPFFDIKLNPIQFRQITAEIFYSRSILKNRMGSIITPNQILLIPPFVRDFGEYKSIDYAKVLYYFILQLGIKFEDIYDPELDAVMNFLVDKDSRIIIYDENNNHRLGDINEGFQGENFRNSIVEGYI